MIKRTIEISQRAVHVSSRQRQIVVQPYDQDKSAQKAIPAEDIGLMMVDQQQATFTTGALATLMDNGSAFVVCGQDHQPLGLMLPMANHSEVVWCIRDQIAASKPTLKRLWQQIVRAKIANHAALLPTDHPAQLKLAVLADEVKSGDTTNVEGQAAKVHWAVWREACEQLKDFRRDPDGDDPANAMLNYGYAILRAAVARAIVSTGLFPTLGLHHHNRANNFCLADDLMEPLRPMVDRRVRDLVQEGTQRLDQETKAQLLHVLTETVNTEGNHGPLLVALPRMTASLLAAYRKETQTLIVPSILSQDDPTGSGKRRREY